MITTSHAVINSLVAHRTGVRTRLDPPARLAFVLGGIAPDLALYALNLGALVYYPLADGVSIGEAHQRAMADLYFNSAWWIVGHSLLHAPMILPAFIVGASVMKPPWRQRVRLFAAGALLHSMIDVVVHHDDGPLVFFPVSWSIRFASPVSYWDPDHYGWLMRPIDLSITAAGTVWLVWWWTRRRDRSDASESH